MMKIKDDKADLAETIAFLQKQIDALRESLRDEVSARESLTALTNQLIKKIDLQSEHIQNLTQLTSKLQIQASNDKTFDHFEKKTEEITKQIEKTVQVINVVESKVENVDKKVEMHHQETVKIIEEEREEKKIVNKKMVEENQ